ncbi:hypothetical protein ACPEEZ_06595 [Frigoribacterium sp. 2-23]|uniref:hypothetical protein n=1 Tax=Frigoribacterium sp. 2-23 TaxID=3415006 RepID=UPI003C702162
MDSNENDPRIPADPDVPGTPGAPTQPPTAPPVPPTEPPTPPNGPHAPGASMPGTAAPGASVPGSNPPAAPPAAPGFPVASGFPAASGQAADGSDPAVRPPLNTLAITGFALSIISLVIGIFGLVPLAGVIVSVLGLRRSRDLRAHGAVRSGLVFAVIGIVVGALSLVLTVAGLLIVSNR